jgi:murein DD-endopeptidase MepM/ murein hydrolase activator NlpD
MLTPASAWARSRSPVGYVTRSYVLGFPTSVARASATSLVPHLSESRAQQTIDPVCANPPRVETISPHIVAGDGGESIETERPLKQGMHYPSHVCNMTSSLAGAGYPVPIISQFTNEVASELRRFQADHGLTANGVYDWGTETVLTRCLSSGPAEVTSPNLNCGAPWGQASPVVPSTSGVSGYRFPLKIFLELNRVDRGQDMESTLHGPFLAIGSGTILSAATGFPGVVLRLSSGPDAGKMVYYGHTFRSYVKVRQKVHAGQVLGLVGHQGASYDPSVYHVEVGFLTANGQVAPGTRYEHWASTGAAMNRLLHQIAPEIIKVSQKPVCARAHRPSYCSVARLIMWREGLDGVRFPCSA